MGKKSAKTGGSSAHMMKNLQKKAAKLAPAPAESDAESEDSGNYMTFNKKAKDSDDEDDQDVFNLALGDDDEDEEDSEGSESGDGSDEDDSEDGEGSEEDDGEGSDDYSDDDLGDDEAGQNLKDLMSNLPTNLRQGVLKRAAIAKQRKAGLQVDSEEESEDEEDEDQEESWGRKASTYRGGDTADLEIGQDMDDALEEEAGALEQHRKKTKRMKASDFMEDFEDSGDEESDSESESSSDDSEVNVGTQVKGGKSKKNGKSRGDAVVGDLAQVSLGQDEVSDDDAAVQVEKVTKSLAHLTKQQRLDAIAKNSPELLGIVSELKDQVSDLKGRIIPVKEFISKIAATHQVQDDVVDYLEVKQQLLLSYCVNVLFYLYMKAQGKSVANHPVMKQLLKLRYVMEKMRPLDGKLKHQVDRLVQLSELSPQDLSNHENTDLLRPNPLALLSATSNGATKSKKSSKKAAQSSDEEEDSESEIEDDASANGYSESKNGKDTGVYKVPKRTAVPYKENETELDRRDERLEKQRNKLKRSELMETLREEFGSAPEAAASSGLGLQSGDLRKLQEEADERTAFEEERFVRMTMSRKDKKNIARRTKEAARLDNFDDIGDIGDFEEMSKLATQSGSSRGADINDEEFGSLGKSSAKQSASMGSALQRAVAALAQSSGGADSSSSKSKMKAMAASLADSDDDDEDPYAAMLAAGPGGDDTRKRRRAPTGSMGFSAHAGDSDEGDFGEESDDGENLLEDFSNKKKKFLAEKKAHYTAEPQYGGFQENVEDGAKRAASYEIIKNKGLTPHRKKANRNPRVKKREMYDKAVIRRKGQVRDVISGAAGSYGGETTGIKAGTARSRKIGV